MSRLVLLAYAGHVISNPPGGATILVASHYNSQSRLCYGKAKANSNATRYNTHILLSKYIYTNIQRMCCRLYLEDGHNVKS